MSSSAAPRCQHIKVKGTRCGSPALRNKSFCFYHQQNRPMIVDCYSDGKYATGEIDLPAFEDAHSVQTVIRQVVQMVLQKRLERKTASLLLYALQIASSNLKRIELEKPQPAEVVTDLPVLPSEAVTEAPIESEIDDLKACAVTAPSQTARHLSQNAKRHENHKKAGAEDSNGTVAIQACYQPGTQRSSESPRRKKQYVI